MFPLLGVRFEWSQVENVDFYSDSHCLTCPAIGYLTDFEGVVHRMNLWSWDAVMGNCARFGAVNGDGLLSEKFRRERFAVLSGGELDERNWNIGFSKHAYRLQLQNIKFRISWIRMWSTQIQNIKFKKSWINAYSPEIQNILVKKLEYVHTAHNYKT